MTPGALIWDFDGTLAFREGMWSGTILEIFRAEYSGSRVTRDDIRPLLRSGFPWHRPEILHPEISDPDAWWDRLQPVLERIFLVLGADTARVPRLAARVRPLYCSPGMWKLYGDTLETLEGLSREGFTHFILSNHVPELPGIAASLGLGELVEKVFSSALTGIEKPNREAFMSVLRLLRPGSTAVMVGDSIEADVRGAMNAGIPGILVRRPQEPGVPWSPDLAGVAGILRTLEDT